VNSVRLYFGLLPPWLDAALAFGGLLLILIPMGRRGARRSVALAYLLGGGGVISISIVAAIAVGTDLSALLIQLFIAAAIGLVLVVAGVVMWWLTRGFANRTPVR
jgi:hypothetical protein